ncbi:MAG: radical SAM family heme chaperone HemW [Candidatus Omnitrophota bacterium]
MYSLYIHIPFCDKKCFYCSFVITVGQLKRADQYIDALKKEARPYQGALIKSIYLGGGTPTTLDTRQLMGLIQFLRNHFRFDHKLEFTIEANPEGLDPEKLAVLKDLGVNRISLGIQSFQDRYLKYLGRIHGRKKALESYALIRKAGFKNVSCDLMMSFPEQTKEQFIEDLTDMLNLSCEHISLYSLTIEPNSRFYAKKILPLDAQTQVEHYELLLTYINKFGYAQYEVSNFSFPGYESFHNMNYWRCGDYLGLGVGAHSYIKGKRFYNVDRFAEYLKMADADNLHPVSIERLDRRQQLKESVLFGLRMTKGVDIEKLQKKYRCKLDQQQEEMIENFVHEGLLIREDNQLKTTNRGLLVLDELCSKLY